MQLNTNQIIFTNIEGKEISLELILKKGPVLISMLRHFGWIFCKEQAAQLSTIANNLSQIGIELIFVGSGNYKQAYYFKEDYSPNGEIYSDMNLTIYNALGARKSLISNIMPQVWLAGLKASIKGFMQSKTQGDYLQQGGNVLVMKDGTIKFLHLHKYAGDHMQPDELLEKIKNISLWIMLLVFRKRTCILRII